MKLFLIKIGKVFSQLKNIGIFGTSKKIFAALYLMISPAGSGDVLFITNGTGDSARYRNWNVAEELKIHGFKCAVTLQDNFWLLGSAKKFKIFIFHRVVYNPKIAEFIAKIKKQGGEIIFETDDLTFDPQYIIKTDNYSKLNALERKQYAGGLGLEILQDPYVKICTTTTTYLAKILEGYSKKVFVVSNKLSNEDIKITEKNNHSKLIQNSKFKIQNFIRIGYFSGTKSHDRDFATVTDALLNIMEKYPAVRLVLAGPLNTENSLNKFKSRIKCLPYAGRKKHFENIAGVDINIVPLEIGDPFCESKSELKFFEAGILEVPTVAAATQTFQEAILDGEDGFIASSSEDWIVKIEKLILDKKLREEMGGKAREKALQKYTTKNSGNEDYYNFLKNRIK
ncbi:MAG: glycosyltransferase [Parcubacteria group bacterium]